jgi:hypothetical protein
MQALLKLFGVTSGNYQDILNAAQSGGAPALGQQSVAAQVIEGFVPGGSLVGALVQYLFNKELLDWKKQQTQKQGRGTFYIDQLESQNQEQLLTATVQSVFDIALSVVGPPEGLVADILRGLKGLASRIGKAGSDFANAALHDLPRPGGDLPEPTPEPEPAPAPTGGPAGADEPTTFDAATFGRGQPVGGAGTGDALRLVKTADGAEVLVARLADGSFRRVEPRLPGNPDRSLVRLSEPGTQAGKGPLLWLDKNIPDGPAYVETADDTQVGLLGGGKRKAPSSALKPGLDRKLGLAKIRDPETRKDVPYDPGSYGYARKNKPGGDTSGWESDHFPPFSAYQDTPYDGVAERRMPTVNLPRELHQPSGEGGAFAGNLASSTGSSELAQTYNQGLTDLLKAGKYGQAFLEDLNEKISLVVLNKSKIPAAQQDLNFWKNEFETAVNYAHQTGLINDGEQFAANQLIDARTAKWLEPEPPYPGVTDAQLQAYLQALNTGKTPDPAVAAYFQRLKEPPSA